LKPLEEKRFFLSRVVRTVKPVDLDCDRLPQSRARCAPPARKEVRAAKKNFFSGTAGTGVDRLRALL
jgi:hypothetical protein